MEKRELVGAIAKKFNLDESNAEHSVNAVITELASPYIFKRPGEEVGFINDNNCTNNCQEPQEFVNLPRIR